MIEIFEEADLTGQTTLRWSGGIHEYQRIFIAKRVDGAGDWSRDDILDQLETDHGVWIGLASGDTRGSTWTCKEIVLEPFLGADRSMRIRAQFTTMGALAGATEETTAPPYVEPSWTPGTRELELYRYGPTVPTNGTVADNFLDIGGTPVDFSGKPFSGLANQETISIDTLWPAIDCYPDTTAFDPLRMTRNPTTFLGRPAGSVLYLGPRLTPTHPQWFTLTQEFLWDANYHLVQRPGLDKDGQPILDTFSGPHGLQAKYVRFFQMYAMLGSGDFEDLFTPAEWDYLNRSCP